MSPRRAGAPAPPASRRRGSPWLPPGELWLGSSPAHPDASAALAFPGSYAAAMASLGFLAVLRELLERGLPTHRIPLADGVAPESLEEGRPLRGYRLLGVSAAYELEAVEAVASFRRGGLDPDPARRGRDDPLIVAGGALTLVNPRLLLAFADAVVVGEGIAAARLLAEAAAGGADRTELLAGLGRLPNVVLSSAALSDEAIDELQLAAQAGYSAAPGPLASPVVTEGTAFGESFLVEACRGCPRGCAFCVLRKDRCGPYTAFDVAAVVEAVPASARRVGLVGAGVSDHPQLDELLERFVARNVRVSTSSLRVGSLDERRVRLLAAAGARQLTVGVDGLTERLRKTLGKPIAAEQILSLAESARAAGLDGLKLYVMVGVPGERDEDVAEFASLVRSASRIVRVAVSAGPLVPKPFTPLADAPFAPESVLRGRLAALRRALGPVARLDLASPRTARREHALAHARLRDARKLCGVER